MIVVEDYNVITENDDFIVIKAKLEAIRKTIKNVSVADYLEFLNSTLKTVDPEGKLYTLSQISIIKTAEGKNVVVRNLNKVETYTNGTVRSVTSLNIDRV